MNTAYTDLKPAWHLQKIQSLRDGKRIVPAQIQLIISDLCNHDCSFCAYRMSGYTSNENFGEMTAKGFTNNPNRKIPFEKCIEILDDAAAAGVKAVQFTGGGEPTVHPDHMTIFTHALQLGLDCSLVTNGNILGSGWDKVLSQFKWVRVSLDAGNHETYAKIRGVPESFFSKALHNIERMAMNGVAVGASYVIVNENDDEMEVATHRMIDRMVPSIRFAAVFTPKDGDYYGASQRARIMEDIERTEWSCGDKITIINQFTSRVDDLDGGHPDYEFCGYQQFNVYIGGDLKVYRCCNTAYSDSGYLGSLKSRRFSEFLMSPEIDKAYHEFDARKCIRCAFNNKNRVINYLVGKDEHVNFV